jgi:PPE-repeat protein
MPTIRPFVIFGCSLMGASAIALAIPATSNAACLLGIQGLVCHDGILNSSTLGPQVGIGNSGGFNGGVLNSGVGNVGILNNGVANAGVLNNGFTNTGIGNLGTGNQGILNGGTAQQGVLNFGGGSLLGLAPGGKLLGIGG